MLSLHHTNMYNAGGMRWCQVAQDARSKLRDLCLWLGWHDNVCQPEIALQQHFVHLLLLHASTSIRQRRLHNNSATSSSVYTSVFE